MILRRASLAESAARVLLAQLDSGKWTDFLPGERVLCEELQISRPTLRQALEVLERNGRLQVTQGRQRRIIGRRTAGVPGVRRQVIGVLSSLPMQALPPFVLFWIDAVRSDLARLGYQLEFHGSPAGTTHNPGRTLERLVQGAPASVWILLLSTPPVQQWFQEGKFPCLVAGSCAHDICLPSVDIDYRAACRHAVGVFRRGGHARLALIIPAGGLAGDGDSEAGFCEATAGGPPPIILRHDGTPRDIVRHLESSLQASDPPTGFLVARSAHVLTVLTLLMRRGCQLPFQAAVISRDDDTFLDFVIPRVARYTSNPVTFARRVSRTVLQMARSGSAASRPIRLMPGFLPGETV
jgi:DNA-binding LacI/PurR family transcriptional regulator